MNQSLGSRRTQVMTNIVATIATVALTLSGIDGTSSSVETG
jgi:hypothetical protein